VVFLTRQAEFAASHFYHNPALSADENRRVFGRCNPPNGHGHNYVLQVTVKGDVNSVTGMVLDLKEMKQILEKEVMDVMDHRFLNHEVPVFATTIPTTENLAIEIWRRLSPRITKGALHRVRLYETQDLFVDYYGE
jgi:6-pyruvoyltetrahydropterin/6-carboxytetrahydropterin synthase